MSLEDLEIRSRRSGADKERRRIRRAIAPHLERLIRHREPSWEALKAIDAATKAPRKARKGKR